MPILDHPYLLILMTSSGAGLAAGFLMHRSSFCMTAMFRDLFLFGDGYLLRMLGLLVVASSLLFELGRLAGILAAEPFPLLGPPSLASLVGGLLFGVGMVLAGGCVVGTLYKMGAGSALAVTAFVGLLTGSALYAEWHPAWSRFAHATTLKGGIVTLPEWLGLPSAGMTLPLAAIGGALLYRWYRRGALQRPTHAAGRIRPGYAALGLALIGFVSYALVGMPLGITTAYAKLGATVEAWFVPEHVAASAYFTAAPLDYVPPFGTGSVSGGPGPALDAIAAIQYPLIAGIVLGALISARRLGEFRVHWRVPARQYLSALAGGILLGAGARMTPGCSVWHLWGGLPILALQSLTFLLGLLPGAWLGGRLLTRYVIR